MARVPRRVVGVMKKWLVLAAALALAGGARAQEPEAPESSLEHSADLVLIGLPVAALGLTFFLSDPAAEAKPLGFDFVHMTGAPRHDLGLALLRTTTITYGLKGVVDEERPNGEDGSFPSGHTAVTFAGAEFIRKQYGWGWGTPAYAAATFVGWSRVETQDHWWQDVLAGAAIGVLSNHDLSGLRTRWGGLAIRPALLQPTTFDGRGNVVAPEGLGGAPGVKLELRF